MDKKSYDAGYEQAKIHTMNAIGEAIAVVSNTDAPDRDIRISAMVHIRALVRGVLEKKKG